MVPERGAPGGSSQAGGEGRKPLILLAGRVLRRDSLQDGTDLSDVVVRPDREQVQVWLQASAAKIAGQVTVHASVSRAGDRMLATAMVEQVLAWP